MDKPWNMDYIKHCHKTKQSKQKLKTTVKLQLAVSRIFRIQEDKWFVPQTTYSAKDEKVS